MIKRSIDLKQSQAILSPVPTESNETALGRTDDWERGLHISWNDPIWLLVALHHLCTTSLCNPTYMMSSNKRKQTSSGYFSFLIRFFLVICLFAFQYFSRQVFPVQLGCVGTLYVDQAGLQFTEICLTPCTTTNQLPPKLFPCSKSTSCL